MEQVTLGKDAPSAGYPIDAINIMKATQVFPEIDIEVRPGYIVPYTPHANQKHVHYPDPEKPYRSILHLGGVRSGKSLCASAEGYACLFIPGYRIWCVGPTYDLSFKVFEKISRWMNKNHPELIASQQRKPFGRLEMKNGAFIECKTASSPESLIGEEVDLILGDEAARYGGHIVNDYFPSRVSNRMGRIILTTTPLGYNHIYKIWELAGTDEGKDLGWQRVRSPTWSNPYMDRGELARIKQLSSKNRWLQDYCAEFVNFAGLVYPGFRAELYPQGHLYNPDNISLDNYDWTHWAGLDIGAAHATGAAFGAVPRSVRTLPQKFWGLPHQCVFVYNEYKQQLSNHSEHARRLRGSCIWSLAQIGVGHDANKTSRMRATDEGTTVQDIYQEQGLTIYPHKHDKVATLSLVDEHFSSVMNVTGSYGRGALISTECEELISDLNRYSYPDTSESKALAQNLPKDHDSDLLDGFRFLIALRPKFLESMVQGGASIRGQQQVLERYGIANASIETQRAILKNHGSNVRRSARGGARTKMLGLRVRRN